MRKRQKKPLIIIAICAIVIIAAIVVFEVFWHRSLLEYVRTSEIPFIQTPPEEEIIQPDELLKQYFVYVGNAQYDDMFEMLTLQSQSEVQRDDFITRNRNIYEGIGAQNFVVSIEQVIEETNEEQTPSPENEEEKELEQGRKIVEYTLSMDTAAGEVSFANQAVFYFDENEGYRKSWSSRSIFPNLDDSDRVWVNALPAQRGMIYDRNFELLAGLGTASSVGLVPGRLRTNEEMLQYDEQSEEEAATDFYEPDLAKIAELLELTVESIIGRLNASYVTDDTFVLLRNISRDAQELVDELLTVQGVLINSTQVRYYPLGERASHLIGYIQNINAEELEELSGLGYHENSVLGKAGLERVFEEELRALDGKEILIVDENGEEKEVLARREPINGSDIQLTIDKHMQTRLFNLFATDSGCSVAMNPKTGEILALVSTPTYNANDFVLGMTASNWTALNEDENNPMFNRFRAAHCPGSTMKAITAAIGVETGIVPPGEDLGHSGLTWRHDESWGGYYIRTTQEYTGPANLVNAMAFSDNIYFAKSALRIGADMFAEELIKMGFGEPIPFEYELFPSVISLTGDFTSEIQLADSGYGQGEILINPIHLAAIYAAFVNNGNIPQPRLSVVGDPAPVFWKENAFSSETANIVLDSLVQVIERGTGTDAQIPGRILAGKTGTAEIKQYRGAQEGLELGWFVMLSAEDSINPLLVVSMVEDVEHRGGSRYVAERVRTLFEDD